MAHQKVVITDNRVNESSGLVHGVLYPDLFYTLNDEPGPIYAIEKTTGKVVGVCTIEGAVLKDSECLDIRNDGTMFVSDSGDNDMDRPFCNLYIFKEPGRGTKTVTAERYKFTPLGGPQNLESFAINPTNNHRYWVSKTLPKSDLYRSKAGTLQPGVVNKLEHLADYLPSLTSDICFSTDGRFVFLRQKGWPKTISVLDGKTWVWLEDIPCPATSKPESITADPDGKTVWVGSEGDDSPLIPVTLPAKYQSGLYVVPAQVLDLTNQKVTKPDASEVLQPALARFHDPKSFRVGEHKGETCVFFRADCDGAHTENSSYPRMETREMKNNGRDKAAWSSTSGTHTFVGRLAFTHLPAVKPQAVGFQIHDGSDDVLQVRLEGRKLFVESPYEDDQLLDDNYELGTVFDLRCEVKSGVATIWYNGSIKARVKESGGGWYFKYGCYTQATSRVSKTDKRYGTGYGEVAYIKAVEKHAA
jgi:hypothetical protein